MARKRLSLTNPFGPATDPLDGPAPSEPTLETKSISGTPPARPTRASGLGTPPIARVAGEASAASALEDMTQAWAEARDSGRMVQSLPLDAIDETWLVRDRITLDTEEMDDLILSLRERGQQVPIEVVVLENGRFGLISGWRRLRALKALAQELYPDSGPERFGHVLALLRRPAGAAEAYRAMVEENEIRAGLSYYERARIALRAAEAGAFNDPRAAIATLFAAGSRAKRSKISSFLTVVEGLDDKLRFGRAIPERLGLKLAKSLDDPAFRTHLRDRLRKAKIQRAEDELALIVTVLALHGQNGKKLARGTEDSNSQGIQRRQEVLPGLWLEAADLGDGVRLTLSGAGLDHAFEARLIDWLRQT